MKRFKKRDKQGDWHGKAGKGKPEQAQAKGRLVGTLGLHPDGFGFVSPLEKGPDDVFVPAHAIGDALQRDIVEVDVRPGRHGKTEGRILKIVERGLKQLVGRFELRGKAGIVITDDLRVKKRLYIKKGKEAGARHGEIVVVKITQYPSGDLPIEGEVIERLGSRGSDETEVKILIARHDLPQKFPENVVEEAEGLAKNFTDRYAEYREDITNLPFMTIDGEDAKDFDDAICAEKLADGSVKVWVSIADVSSFVEEDSLLDKEAGLRGTSVYLPGTCIPMLPEALSNETCSLVPGEPRFTFTAEFIIASDGTISRPRFYKSVIKSKYRMTYTEVNEHFTSTLSPSILRQAQDERAESPAPSKGDVSQRDASPIAGGAGRFGKDVLRSLENANLASSYFKKARRKRGSIDFDLPEPQIVLDLTGRPEKIVKAERNMAHMLIEDLMIAANEVVATFLLRRSFPCIYRIHDKPNSEKLEELKVLLKYIGINAQFGREVEPRALAALVKKVEGRPEERLINTMLLRSMSQAVYSTNNIGHFGLASKCYCHFTSPIRRYPDLLVHRVLTQAIIGKSISKKGKLKHLAKDIANSVKTERRAMEAERESLKLYAAIFMKDKIGEVYEGIVSHTAKMGLFIQLNEFFVEGLVIPQDLSGDTYTFEPKRYSYVGKKIGNSIHIGDKMKVRVKDVVITDRRIYFEPA